MNTDHRETPEKNEVRRAVVLHERKESEMLFTLDLSIAVVSIATLSLTVAAAILYHYGRVFTGMSLHCSGVLLTLTALLGQPVTASWTRIVPLLLLFLVAAGAPLLAGDQRPSCTVDDTAS